METKDLGFRIRGGLMTMQDWLDQQHKLLEEEHTTHIEPVDICALCVGLDKAIEALIFRPIKILIIQPMNPEELKDLSNRKWVHDRRN